MKRFLLFVGIILLPYWVGILATRIPLFCFVVKGSHIIRFWFNGLLFLLLMILLIIFLGVVYFLLLLCLNWSWKLTHKGKGIGWVEKILR